MRAALQSYLPKRPSLTACLGSAFGGWYSLTGYKFHEKIGAGAFGQVRACTQKSTGAQLAVKIVHVKKESMSVETLKAMAALKGSLSTPALKSLALSEGVFWRECCDHENVVQLYNVFFAEGCAFFLMERCQFTLMDFLEHADEDLTEGDFEVLFFQMLRSLEHVHSNRIVHRDIKPANFLVQAGTIKLCDFGLATRAVPSLGCNRDYKVGSGLFMAPEMHNLKAYDCKVDIWSLGVTLYVISCGLFPYNGSSQKDVAWSIIANDPEPTYCPGTWMDPLSPSRAALLKELLQHNVDRRKSATELLHMEPLSKYSQVRLLKSFSDGYHVDSGKASSVAAAMQPAHELSVSTGSLTMCGSLTAPARCDDAKVSWSCEKVSFAPSGAGLSAAEAEAAGRSKPLARSRSVMSSISAFSPNSAGCTSTGSASSLGSGRSKASRALRRLKQAQPALNQRPDVATQNEIDTVVKTVDPEAESGPLLAPIVEFNEEWSSTFGDVPGEGSTLPSHHHHHSPPLGCRNGLGVSIGNVYKLVK